MRRIMTFILSTILSLYFLTFISPKVYADISASYAPDPIEFDQPVTFTISGCKPNEDIDFTFEYPGGNSFLGQTTQADGSGTGTFTRTFNKQNWWRFDVSCIVADSGGYERENNIYINIPESANPGDEATPTQPPPPPPLCATGGFVDGKCVKVDTAIGEINTDGPGFIYSLFIVILSLSGGVLLLSIIYAGYLLMMSRGEPEKVQKGKELLTSAIVGFLFILFSYLIFGVITVDILKLPGFSN